MVVTRASASKHTLSASPNSKSRNKNNSRSKTKKKTTRTESDDAQQKPLSPSPSLPGKRNKSLGVRLVHGRIYDSQNGKTCHQCRQKTLDFAASCKNQSDNRQCTFHFCHKCLINRYGEKAEEVTALKNWICPKCRGICNCSLCMKKRGCRPTGMLVHTALSPKKRKLVNEFHSCKKNIVEKWSKRSVIQISLPQGIELTNVANIDMPAEAIGDALQFLEFCEAFGQVLHLNKGQPESLLRELACRRRSSRRIEDSPIVMFHVKLLSMIQKDSGKVYPSLKSGGRNSWLQYLSKLISESQSLSKELLLDSVNVDTNGYEELNSSKRLRLLNFLCDEALGTEELRSWIDEKKSEFVEEEKKKAKEKVIAEKEKEKNIKKKLQDEMARAILLKNGVPLSISEYDNLISKIKAEVAQTLAETLEATSIVMKKEQRSDAVRAEPILSDASGRKFWKLRGYSCENDLLLQDVGSGDLVSCMERWFVYDVEQKTKVENYISSVRSTEKKETEECGTNILEMGKKKVVVSRPV